MFMNFVFCIVFSLITGEQTCLGQCPANLGRTIERLPNTDVNAFSQQENPSNTASATCPYTTGGVVATYPIDWFTQSPSVRISIQTATFDPQTEYFAEVSSNSAGTTTIKVSKYNTNALCTAGTCNGLQCANTPRCEGTCTITSSEGTCANNCSGSCATSCACAAIADNTCTSICQGCAGECAGLCSAMGPNSQCSGSSFVIIPSFPSVAYDISCNGVCASCFPGTCNGDSFGNLCRGICSRCITGSCDGVLITGADIPTGLSFIRCDGTVTGTCTGQCTGVGACTDPIVGNCMNNAVCTNCGDTGLGNGLCSPTSGFTGDCPQVGNSQCTGVCYSCTGGCSGLTVPPAPAGGCIGICNQCAGRCQGNIILTIGNSGCIGTASGNCAVPVPNTDWFGDCDDCNGSCNGNGSLIGGNCIRSSQSSAVEVAAGEVTVNFYAIEQ